jgi:hypothetical protein
VTVRFAWMGRYRTNGGTWINLGTLSLDGNSYDVDE